MNSIPVWREETRVKAYEADFAGFWKPATFFQVMTAAASEHAAQLGYEFERMMSEGMIWVLSRMKMRFFDFPKIRETVVIETWPKGVQQKVFFYRDFKVMRPDGALYALATSAWVLIDPHVRKMLLPQVFRGQLPDNSGLHAMTDLLEKIALPEGMKEVATLEAGYSAVDVMGHVNNGRYIEWISDCFSLEEYRTQKLESLQINFNNEVLPGERIVITAVQNPVDQMEWLFQGSHLANGTKAFEAAWRWCK